MKISYAITVCNETDEIKHLFEYILKNKRINDEIVILFDSKNGNEEVKNYLERFTSVPNVYLKQGEFIGNFSEWKNKLNSYCSGDYIFNIDADEYPNESLFYTLPSIIREYPDVEMFYVPRINLVKGITKEHIYKWNWEVNEEGYINFPDYQTRIYKNLPTIKWKGRVHERIEGYKQFSSLPPEEEYCLHHIKSIEKQEKQNNYYSSL